MIWERIVDVALRAYPREVRDTRGAEMRDTAVEAASESRRSLFREGVPLLAGGMSARANAAASLGGRRLVAEGCARAVPIWGLAVIVVWAAMDRLAYEYPSPFGPGVMGFVLQGLLTLSIALALIGEDRLAGLSGIAWICVSLAQELSWRVHAGGELVWVVRWAAFHLPPLVGYLVLAVAPRSRSRELRRLAWLVGAVLLGTLLGPLLARVLFLEDIALDGIAVLAIATAGALSLAGDPRWPVAAAFALIARGLPVVASVSIGSTDAHHYTLLALTMLLPMMLLAGAAARLVSARRGLPS